MLTTRVTSSYRERASAMLCVSIVCSVFVLGLAIPTVYFGHLDKDSTCQHGERAGMILSSWVLVSGWSAIGLAVFMITTSALSMLSETVARFCLESLTPAVLLTDILFWIAWWIIGIVVVATNENNECVADGKGMAVMAIITLVIGCLRFSYANAAVATA